MGPEKTEVLLLDPNGRAECQTLLSRAGRSRTSKSSDAYSRYYVLEAAACTTQNKDERKETSPQKPTEKSSVSAQKKKRKTPKKTSFLTANLENRIIKANNSFYSCAAPLYRRKDVT